MTIETKTPVSWKPEWKVEGKFYPNGQAFATREEAEASAKSRYNAWTQAEDHRAVESDQPVNYVRVDGRDVPIEDAPPTEPTTPPQNTYIAFYNRKQIEVKATTSLEAQTIAAKHFKREKKPWEVTVVIAQRADGTDVIHSTADFG